MPDPFKDAKPFTAGDLENLAMPERMLELALLTTVCPGEYHHLTTEGVPCCLAYITRAPIPDCGGTSGGRKMPNLVAHCRICGRFMRFVREGPYSGGTPESSWAGTYPLWLVYACKQDGEQEVYA